MKSIRLDRIGQVEKIVKGDRITLRIPSALVSDGEGRKDVDYTDPHGLRDGDRAYRPLTRQGA